MFYSMLFSQLLFSLGIAQSLQTLPKQQIQIGDQSIEVEVADEPHERQIGLMFRDSLEENQGMIFVYEKAKPLSFWMKNTRIPLSIAYISAECKIVRIEEMFPFVLDGVPSGEPVQFALEMNQGWFEKNKVYIGSELKGISGCGVTPEPTLVSPIKEQ